MSTITDKDKHVAVACDHAGLLLKQTVVSRLRESGFEVSDLGTESGSPVDYPDIAEKCARAVASKEAVFGVLICGTGIGVSIAANKIRGVRAAVCRSSYEAGMARLHNNANILCLGERVSGTGIVEEMLDTWIGSAFEGGRHQSRVDKIKDLEIKEIKS